MKKLLAVSVMAVLLCTLLVSNVFALTAPSIPTGVSAITPAGYLLDGEVGNEEVKYATNLPLGEIKDNIAAAPSPNGKKAAPVVEEVVEEEVVEEIVEEEVVVEEVEEEAVVEEEVEVPEIEDVEGVIGEVDALEADYAIFLGEEAVFTFNSAALIEAYVPEEALIVADAEAWELVEEDTVITLAADTFCFAADVEGFVSIAYNMSGEDLEVEVIAGTYIIVYSFIADIEEMDFVGAIVSAYAEIANLYASLEIEDVELAIALTVVMPEGLDSLEFTVAPVVIEEVEEDAEADEDAEVEEVEAEEAAE